MSRPGESEASVMDHDDLRIGDAEREQTMTALREHFAQGRLTHEELDERLDQALAARTGRDLARITADLPGHGPARPPGLPPVADLGPWPDAASWQEAMRAHRKQMKAFRHQMRHHHRGPMHPRHHGHRGPGPIVPILFVFLMVGLFAGGFGVLKFLFFIWIGAMVFMFVRRRFGSRR
ncbi:DUF1707 domain-containing protein [Nonomuraea sp. C10]|uniref:DUF1707 SHOCT-like domain-containing protein n=1 Tax=Nonomuraea sp. C10 TaxID=2600577 RepID=UPI0011CE82F7|nr:DUF1707 domain-containing protein [Nonomuraea sp. C10]TXK39513.1 DUF1707 domain-containing protein [Nonomuraea sp. C10]